MKRFRFAAVSLALALPVGASAAEMTDKEWVADQKPKYGAACLQVIPMVNNGPNGMLLTQPAIAEICECSSKKYFANPIPKLRALHKARDVQGNKKYMLQAMTSCTQEYVDRHPQ